MTESDLIEMKELEQVMKDRNILGVTCEEYTRLIALYRIRDKELNTPPGLLRLPTPYILKEMNLDESNLNT